MAGLIIGKPVGVVGGAWLAHRAGIGRLPAGLGWADMVGVGLLAGIGFTVALFITELATSGEELSQAATIAVLLASAVSGVLALAWLFLARRMGQRQPEA